MFINTTPHTINLKLSDGRVIMVEPTADEKMNLLFRCETRSERSDNLLVDESAEIKVSRMPVYTLNHDLFQSVFTDRKMDGETWILMSTIAASAWKKSGWGPPPGCWFFVPYSGPDASKCLREKGSIVWVAELIDYT